MIVIHGQPKPKKSVRFHGHAYNPQKKDMDAVKLIVKSQWALPPIEGVVILDVTFYMQIPNSWSKKKKERMNGQYHTSRPDRDNLMKFIKDCMTKIVYNDDCQVADGPTRKIYGNPPRTEIKVTGVNIDEVI